ncbi:dihydroorotate dehydrogenase (quinone) [Streptosporangium jomthongense]|nr:dihydroorotate dehydrogenase (quinone) [Streptosporangium jomthongense]
MDSLLKTTNAREAAFLHALSQARLPRADWKDLAKAATPITLMGLSFPNRLGIAAGFDRLGRLGRLAGNLGFGAIELGSWTQETWPDKPISAGPQTLLNTQLGIRLAVAAPVSPELETRELARLMEKAWQTADYLCLSPEWLQMPVSHVQHHTNMRTLLEFQQTLVQKTRKKCPVVYKLKVVPGGEEPFALAHYLACQGVDGILISFDFGKGAIRERYRSWLDPEFQATVCRSLETFRRHIKDASVLITNGGILSQQDFLNRVQAGADLTQVHNALVLKGADIGWKINDPASAQPDHGSVG